MSSLAKCYEGNKLEILARRPDGERGLGQETVLGYRLDFGLVFPIISSVFDSVMRPMWTSRPMKINAWLMNSIIHNLLLPAAPYK